MNWDFDILDLPEDRAAGSIAEQIRRALSLEKKVRIVDSNLEFVRYLGGGSSAEVAKVKKGKEFFALKVMASYDPPISDEYGILCELSGIRGIPVPYRLYETAILMGCVDGVNLMNSRQGRTFFSKLRKLTDDIHGRGYSLPADFSGRNLMADTRGNPWVVDLMHAKRLKDYPRTDLVSRDIMLLRNLERLYRR